MLQISETPVSTRTPTQAIELAQLIDLEACWENLRKPAPEHKEVSIAVKDLAAKQNAYEAFHVKFVAYNKQYADVHVPELMLNTPSRLRVWCEKMRTLYLQLEHEPRARCPVYLLEKAYRFADQIGIRLNKTLLARQPRPTDIRGVIRALESLTEWCVGLTVEASPKTETPVLEAA